MIDYKKQGWLMSDGVFTPSIPFEPTATNREGAATETQTETANQQATARKDELQSMRKRLEDFTVRLKAAGRHIEKQQRFSHERPSETCNERGDAKATRKSKSRGWDFER